MVEIIEKNLIELPYMLCLLLEPIQIHQAIILQETTAKALYSIVKNNQCLKSMPLTLKCTICARKKKIQAVTMVRAIMTPAKKFLQDL